MSNLMIRPGIILLEIHGVYLLAAEREARRYCSFIRQINELGALIWEELKDGKSREEIILRIRQEYEVPEDTDLRDDVDSFLKSLKENHYIICEAGCHEV